MFAKLFRRASTAPSPLPRIPDGRRIYAIGDVHGCLALLDGLLERIHADDRARGGPAGEIVLLGDLIDRGPDSAGVIGRLMALAAKRPTTRFLLGNHEEVFLNALAGDDKALRLFHRIGGAETLYSYGIAPDAYARAGFEEMATMLEQVVPDAHRRFLKAFEHMIVVGDYAFVHAGIHPDVPLAEQRPEHLRWIRDAFLSADATHEKMIVHGHTIVEAVEQLPNRIALDTGAYQSGLLTAMGLEGEARWLLQEDGIRALP